MTTADILMLIAVICIWSLLLVNVVLIIAGYLYYIKIENEEVPEIKGEAPFVSIMVPAHNEGKVITKTVESLLALDYPHDRYEIIVINDNSSDNSSELLGNLQRKHDGRNLIVINTDAVTGGKGKSNALNIGFKQSRGELIAIYDADNTPEKTALRYLVAEITNDDTLGAVIGKFRTRNRNTNLLTRFINIETLSFQWMAQAGRWKLFKLCTIPGTNFIMRRSIVESIGGWDVKAIAEDTEISFRIYMMGYRIKFQPKSVTWEQEPQTVKVWFKQRTRWAKGNIYVIIKNIPLLFDRKARNIRFDILYFYRFTFAAYLIGHVRHLAHFTCLRLRTYDDSWLQFFPMAAGHHAVHLRNLYYVDHGKRGDGALQSVDHYADVCIVLPDVDGSGRLWAL